MNDSSAEPVVPPRRFLVSNVVVGLGTLLCRVTGFGRILALAYAVGLGGLSDVYNTANTTPNIIYELMLGGMLSATLLPSFVRAFKDNDVRAISAILSVIAVALGVLTVVMVLLAPFIMDLYSLTRADHPQQFHAVGVHFVRLFMPQIFFYGLISLATAFLNAQHKFALPAYAPILNNIIVIGILMAMPHIFGGGVTLERAAEDAGLVAYLGIGTTAGIALSALALVPAMMRSGVSLSFVPEWRHPAVMGLLKLSGWTLGYVIANQAALFLVSLVALHREGWMTAYQTAFAFFVLPHGLLAMTITTTFMPRIARDGAAGDMAGFSAKMMHGVWVLCLLMLPASVGYMMIAKPLVVTLLQHGQFDAVAAHLTGGTLSMFAVGLLPFSLYLFLLRGFYAVSDAKTPFKLNLFENGLNILLAVPLAMLLGVQGLALAYALAYCGAVVLTFAALNRRVGGGMAARLVDDGARLVLAVSVMAFAVACAMRLCDGVSEYIQIGAAVVTGGLVYGGMVLGLKLVDIRALRSA